MHGHFWNKLRQRHTERTRGPQQHTQARAFTSARASASHRSVLTAPGYVGPCRGSWCQGSKPCLAPLVLLQPVWHRQFLLMLLLLRTPPLTPAEMTSSAILNLTVKAHVQPRKAPSPLAQPSSPPHRTPVRSNRIRGSQAEEQSWVENAQSVSQGVSQGPSARNFHKIPCEYKQHVPYGTGP
jgi:hypothetical protein